MNGNKEITDLLNELKFFGMKESLERRMTQARKTSMDFEEFFSLVLEDEKLYRINRKSEMLRKRGKFNERVYLDEYRDTGNRGISKSMIKNFKSLYFVDTLENIIFIGSTGTGKSFLAQAIGHEACSCGVEVFFISVNRLFKEIELADKQGTYLSYLNRLKNRVKVLILDDFGLRNYSHGEANALYDILEDRCQKGSVIVTSQLDPRGWKVLIEDKVIADAIFDRITATADIIHVKGSSFRKNKKRKRGLKTGKK